MLSSFYIHSVTYKTTKERKYCLREGEEQNREEGEMAQIKLGGGRKRKADV